jgi:hypothetical protein
MVVAFLSLRARWSNREVAFGLGNPSFFKVNDIPISLLGAINSEGYQIQKALLAQVKKKCDPNRRRGL